MREYFKTDARQFAFRPKTFNTKQQIVRVKKIPQNWIGGTAKDWLLVKLDENRILAYPKSWSGFIGGQNANIWLINLNEKTLNLTKPPAGQAQKLASTGVALGFCKLENEILAFCGASGVSTCVLKGDTWELVAPAATLVPSGGVCYGGIASGGGFYDYADGNLKYNSAISSNFVAAKTVPIRKELVSVTAFAREGNYGLTNSKTWDKTGVQGLFCPVNLETGWIEGNTHYAFDGENLVITEFIQDNIIEIKE